MNHTIILKYTIFNSCNYTPDLVSLGHIDPASVAQLDALLTGDQDVVVSNPVGSATFMVI